MNRTKTLTHQTIQSTRLTSQHQQEIVTGSGIDPALAGHNFKSLDGDQAQGLLNSWFNPGAGWAFQGQQGTQVKPDNPIRNKKNGKLNKYLCRSGITPKPFKAWITYRLAQKIADKAGVGDKYQIPHFINIDTVDEQAWEKLAAIPEIPLVCTEGAKKACALISSGYLAVGAVGVYNFTPKGKILIKELLQVPRKLVFAFDQDIKPKTIRNVTKALISTAETLTRSGLIKQDKIHVATWSIANKGIDDLLVNEGINGVEKSIDEAQSFRSWRLRQENKIFPTHAIKLNQRYLYTPELVEQIKQFPQPLVVVNSFKNTGKSYLVQQLFKSIDDPKLTITHRIQLTRQLCKLFGIPYVEEVGAVLLSIMAMGLCIDSVHPKSQAKFEVSHWAGTWIFIDEFTQVVKHLLNSSTCSQHRIAIIQTLRELLPFIVESGGKLIVADADANDMCVQFLAGLMGIDDEDILYIINEFKTDNFKVIHWNTDSPYPMLQQALKAAKEGKRLLIQTTGQKHKSKTGTQNLEKLFIKHGIPPELILRIDSVSTSNPDHPAYGCMSGNLSRFLFQYQIVIASPTIETGVSIEEEADKFDENYILEYGLGDANSARQKPARLRDFSVDRNLWVPERGWHFVGGGQQEAKKLIWWAQKTSVENLEKLNEPKHKKEQQIRDLRTARDLQELDLYLEDSEIEGSSTSPEIMKVWGQLGASTNFQMSNFAFAVLQGLEDEGCKIETLSDTDIAELGIDPNGTALKEELKAISDEAVTIHRQEVTVRESVTSEELQALRDKQAKTKIERQTQTKGDLEQRYGVPVTPELQEKNDDGWYSKINLLYFSDRGDKYLHQEDFLKARSHIKRGDGEIYIPDFNKYQMSCKVSLIKDSGVLKLLEKSEIDPTDPDVIAVFDWAVENRSRIHRHLGFHLNLQHKENSVISVIKQLLDKIGFNIYQKCKRKIDGKRVNIYSMASPEFQRDNRGKPIKIDGDLIPLGDGREAVFTYFDERYGNKRVQLLEEQKTREIGKCILAIREAVDKNNPELLKALSDHPYKQEAWKQLSPDETIAIRNLINGQPDYKQPEIVWVNQHNIQEVLNTLDKRRKLSLDIETYGNDQPNKNGDRKEGLHQWKGFIRLIQIFDGDKTYIFDLGSRESNRKLRETELKQAGFFDALASWLANPEVKIMGHNIKFDLGFIAAQYGITGATNVWDTLLGLRVLFGDYGRAKIQSYSLGNLCKHYLNLELDKSEQTSDWGGELTPSQINYSALDPWATWLLFEMVFYMYQNLAEFNLEPFARDDVDLLDGWKLENDVIVPTIQMELNGLPVDVDKGNELIEKAQKIQNILLNKWSELCPEFKHTQSTKVLPWLQTKYPDLELPTSPKTGKPTAPKGIKNKYKDSIPEFKLIRQLDGIKNYIDEVSKLMRVGSDGNVHTNFRTSTGTGRFASGSGSKKFADIQNLQNVLSNPSPDVIYDEPLIEACLSNPGTANLVKQDDSQNQLIDLPTPRVLVKPKPNDSLAVIDLSAAHWRIACDLSNDKAGIEENGSIERVMNFSSSFLFLMKDGLYGLASQLLEKYTQDKDAHMAMAQEVAKIQGYDWDLHRMLAAKKDKSDPIHKLVKRFRASGKNVKYGRVNNGGKQRIATEITKNTGKEPDMELLENSLKAFDQLYFGFTKYRYEEPKRVNRNEWCHGDKKYAVSQIPRVPFNLTWEKSPNPYRDRQLDAKPQDILAGIWSRIEATAMKRSLIRIHTLAQQHLEWRLRVINYVHDEFNILTDREYYPEAIQAVLGIVNEEFQALLEKVHHGGTDNPEDVLAGDWSQK